MVISLFLHESCGRKQSRDPAVQEEAAAVDTLPDEFVYFFDRFHSDSQYQMDHIVFPLEGLPNSLEGEDTLGGERYFWQREEWKMHHPFQDPSDQFENWFEVLNDRIIEHWVRMKGTQLVIRRRFAKLDDEWYLIYYAGIRPKDTIQ